MEPILVIEDDEMLNAGLCYNLILEGYQAEGAKTLEEAQKKVEQQSYELLIVDVNLPDGSGLSFCRWFRERSQVPLLFLTARDLDEDMMKGFEAGADDYITKPFNVKVLMQRVQAVLRRVNTGGKPEQKFVCGNLSIDFEKHMILKGQEALTLTPTEYKLLHKFCQNQDIVLTREVLLDELWDQHGNFVDEHTLTINISRLKKKIADEQFTYIKSVYGTGYQWIGEGHE